MWNRARFESPSCANDRSHPTHDDPLLSAALIAHLDTLIRKGKLLLGSARSEVLPTPDPLGRPVY